jgi:hypothetical protein
MAERENHIRRRIFLGAIVVALAMAAWVFIIDIAARH